MTTKRPLFDWNEIPETITNSVGTETYFTDLEESHPYCRIYNDGKRVYQHASDIRYQGCKKIGYYVTYHDHLNPPEKDSRYIRRKVLEAWDRKCCYCGDKGTTIDHLHPRSKGGATVISNLACACSRCNLSKKSHSIEDWYLRQSFFCSDRLDALIRWQRSPWVDEG